MGMWMLPVGMAALGAYQGAQKKKAEDQWNRGQAEVTRYSPWTGISGQLKPSSSSMLGGAMQGGLSGAMLGQHFGGGSTTEIEPSAMDKLGKQNASAFGSGDFGDMKGISNTSGGQGLTDQMGRSQLRGYNANLARSPWMAT